MKKTILFRGKRTTGNKEWVYGYYVRANRHWHEYGVLEDWIITDVIQNGGMFNVGRRYPVDAKTVGQFTGLTDKNGKKIFEGDIISATTLDTGKEQRAVVCFGNFIDANNNDEYIGFFIEFDGIETTITQLSMEECKNRIEVIGNKYDNKELLK